MKKLMALLLALALTAGALAACTTPTGDTPAEGGSDAEITLKWAVWDIHLTTYYDPLIEAFTAKYPNVKIEMTDLGSADYNAQLLIQLAGGEVFDLITIKDMPGYGNFITQNRIEPLNDYMEAAGVDPAVFGGVVEQLSKDGVTYTLPFRSDFWITYYNKDHFDTAGVEYPDNDMTFAEYEEKARAVTQGEGAEKIYGTHFHTWRSAVQLMSVLDGENSIVGGEYEFLKPNYEWILGMQNDGIVQNYADLKAGGIHYSGVFFNSQIAMMHMGSWFVPTQIQMVDTGESTATNWGIVKYPHPEGVEPGTTLGTITGISVGSASEHKDAAWDFVNFISGPEGAAVLANIGQFPAIMTDDVVNTIASMPGFPEDEASKEALYTATRYLEMPLADAVAEIEIVLNEAHDNIMLGNVTVDEGIADMNTRVQEIIAAQ